MNEERAAILEWERAWRRQQARLEVIGRQLLRATVALVEIAKEDGRTGELAREALVRMREDGE